MKRLLIIGILLSPILASATKAVDFEAFDFNDPAGTVLANATNSINAANKWIEDPQMAPSDIRGGVYNIVKGSLVLESNYLQVANITSGTRYLVLQSSGWDFVNFDSTRLEEFRLAFLNDDTGNSGSTITAQMSIRRNATGNVEIAGDSLGTGSTNLPAPAAVATTQTAPFTAVLEINKTSNTYKVYYKDGTNPSQVLGMGAIAPTRGGNSLRMSVNNDFSAFNFNYPIDPPSEVFAVDRIAVTDTNPITDLITLEVDRTSGVMTLRNTTGTALTGIESYSIGSTAGAFDPTKWKTVTGNYDSAGNGSVDNAPWSITTSSKTQLAEAFVSGDGGALTNNQSVVLSLPAGGTWLKSPFEDLQMTLNLAGGATRTVNVNFIGNSGLKWASGDFNFDNALNGADWLSFIANSETNLTGLSRVEAYQRGDLNGDGLNTIADFVAFRTAYDFVNGAGSFMDMVATVPEPRTLMLLALVIIPAAVTIRRRSAHFGRCQMIEGTTISITPMKAHPMRPSFDFAHIANALLLAVIITPAARAVILEDFPFNDVNSTPIEAAENVAHVGNNFFLGTTANWDPSSTLSGSYRIAKSSTGLTPALLDIDNVTTGKVWLVTEFAGWNYTGTPSSTSEEIRVAFLDNDPVQPNSSTITAQMNIIRSGSGLALNGVGALGGGVTNVAGTYLLPLTRSTPFTMVLELDKNLDQYSVYYKDDTAAYALLGTAELGTSTLNSGDRDGNGIRFAATGQFNDIGEFVDVNRIYLTNTSPIGSVTPVALTLEATSNGLLSIKNTTPNPISLDSYRIASASNSLNFAGWNSLSDQGISPMDGPDNGTTLGDGIGETWDEAGGSNDGLLAESFLLGSTTLAPNDSLPLGSGYKLGGLQDLTLQYHDFVTGAIVSGDIDYVTVAGVPGDYNNNGVVDTADYVVWRNANGTATQLQNEVAGTTPGQVTADDYTAWRARFGKTSGSGATFEPGGGAGVPEPTSLAMILIASLAMLGRIPKQVHFCQS